MFIGTRKWICRRRTARTGSGRPVLIFRFVSRHTIESEILQRASEKRQLEALVIAKGASCTTPSGLVFLTQSPKANSRRR
ncbi:hypothetical protein H4582DRAFT_1947448 [Lactarius indigo]|nr:hypothetical protein H4582DRAFT_1947448 [Lactarius indigo]